MDKDKSNAPKQHEHPGVALVHKSRPPIADGSEVISLRDPEALQQILDQPLDNIAAFLTGSFSMGRSDAVLVGGRIAQGALKGKLLMQVGREIKSLIEKGRIKEDYAKTKYGFKSLVELLEFIDTEVPDEDRFRAVKTMFIAINSADVAEGDEVLNYQLFQICKKLSGHQLLILKVCYDLRRENVFADKSLDSARAWANLVGQRVGHKVPDLIEVEDEALVAAGLLTARKYPDRSGINPTNARLTDLGLTFCDCMATYGDWGHQASK